MGLVMVVAIRMQPEQQPAHVRTHDISRCTALDAEVTIRICPGAKKHLLQIEAHRGLKSRKRFRGLRRQGFDRGKAPSRRTNEDQNIRRQRLRA